MSESLYEQIGGNLAVKATVAKLYEKILADEILIPFFVDVDVDGLRRSQAAFVTMAFGGPNNYSGQGLRIAHKNLVEQGLSDPHFDAVAAHFKKSMEELGVPKNLMEQALAIVEGTRDDVLNR